MQNEARVTIVAPKSRPDHTCPFGKAMQGYWDNRFEYFSKFSQGILCDEQGLYSVKKEQLALELADMTRGNTVLELFGGIGGTAIAQARSGKKVYYVEKNKDRYEMAQRNAEIYGVKDRMEFYHNDAIDFIASCDLEVDVVVMDPPWGGVEAFVKGRVTLDDFPISDDYSFVDLIKACKGIPKILIMPHNFDLLELQKVSDSYYIKHFNDQKDCSFIAVFIED